MMISVFQNQIFTENRNKNETAHLGVLLTVLFCISDKLQWFYIPSTAY